MNRREIEKQRKIAIRHWAHLLIPGAKFDTPFEQGCTVTQAPDDVLGNFVALDSEGVECSFGITMVTEVYSS